LLIDGPRQDLDDAQRLIEQALEIWRELGDPATELRALNELGLVNSKAGRPAEADRWYEEGLALARRVGDTSGEWMLLQNQAVLAHLEARAGRTNYTRVLELYRSSLDRRRRLGLPYVLSLANLAQAEVEAGHLDQGRRNATEALRTAWTRHDPLDWTIAMITFAQLEFVDGRVDEGLSILGTVLGQRRTPSLEREIDAVLEYHGIDQSTAATAIIEAAAGDLAAIIDHLLRDQT
jgi:tetratricopeptide (TPR) repeat protein